MAALPRVIANRTLPHSAEAEQSVLGALLIDATAVARVADLTPADFCVEGHADIFEAIKNQIESSGAADSIEVAEALKRTGRADALAYLNSLAASVPTAGNVRRYADIVIERAQRRRAIEEAEQRIARAYDLATPIEARSSGWSLPAPISADELRTARLHPRCIVEDYLFADVAVLVAPGSTGKTTATLYEAACIVLGLPLWGLNVVNPGPVLIVTAEDRREFLVARLREIMAAMRLSPEQVARVLAMVPIDDQTTKRHRLTAIAADAVVATSFAGHVVAACKAKRFAPVMVQFDPLVSFGVGEARVNDAEQGLVEAARVITAGLDCCTRYVHHTSKIVARDKTADQYAGRGGGALADGARMVHVMHSLDAAEFEKETGERLDDGQSAFALYRPKISYAPPQREPTYVRRTGYAFEQLRPIEAQTGEGRLRAVGDQLARFIEAEHRADVRHTKHTLEQIKPDNLSRADVRAGLAWLQSRGRLRVEAVIGPDGKPPANGARDCLRVPDQSGEPTARRSA